MNGGCRFAQNKIDKCSIGFVFWMVVGEGGKKKKGETWLTERDLKHGLVVNWLVLRFNLVLGCVCKLYYKSR